MLGYEVYSNFSRCETKFLEKLEVVECQIPGDYPTAVEVQNNLSICIHKVSKYWASKESLSASLGDKIFITAIFMSLHTPLSDI